MNCLCLLRSIRPSPFSVSPLTRSLATEAIPKKSNKSVPLSTVEAGTVLSNINFLKDGVDPIALQDSEYPTWLFQSIPSSAVTKKKGKAVELTVAETLKAQRDELRRAGRKAIKGRNDLG